MFSEFFISDEEANRLFEEGFSRAAAQLDKFREIPETERQMQQREALFDALSVRGPLVHGTTRKFKRRA